MRSTPWQFEVLEGEEAIETLRDAGFVAQWRRLAGADTSVTWFQEPPFVSAWYATYRQVYTPLLALAGARDGSLVGLAPLARERTTGHITHAGARQAHYQGWIAVPDAEDAFLRATIRAVFERSRQKRWSWKYVPPGKDLGTLFDETQGGFRARTTTRPTPVWSLVAAKQRRHRNLRKLLERYRERGEIALLHAADASQAAALLERMALWDDLRLGAVRADLPFRDDPLKLAFLNSLLEGGTGVRVSAWCLDGRPVAVYAVAFDGKDRCLGLAFGADPAEARSSPTLVGLLELGEALAGEGVQEYDMIPGGEPWKERFATDHRLVTEVEIFADAAEARRARRRQAVTDGAKMLLRAVGQEPGEVKRRLSELRRRVGAGAHGAWKRMRLEKTLVFACAPETVSADLPAAGASEDSLADLLRYDKSHARADSRAFFAQALKFLRADWCPLTLRSREGLALAAWCLVPRSNAAIEGLGDVPAGAFLLWFVHCEPETGETEVRRLLAQAVAAAQSAGAAPLWVLTSSRLAPVRRWCERNGRLVRALPPR